jgi:hypothetical protein
MEMDSINGACSLNGFQDSPACVSGETYTCAHGKTLRWEAARRALGLDPLLAYMCTHKKRHVAWEHNDLGAVAPCGQCGKPSVCLSFDDMQKRGLVRFVDRSRSRLSS